MKTRRFVGTLSAMAICLAMIPLSVAAARGGQDKAPQGNSGTAVYADYGTGFEFLTELEFDKKVTEEKVDISRPVTAIRIVKGDCYELNLDQVTLDGKCPAGYERKLSATDNDLIEVEGSIDLDLNGSGELIIAARAPKELKGEEYSFKFPEINTGRINPMSEFYRYKVGSNPGSFSMGDELVIPGEEYLFDRIMCHPSSGHPDAPMFIYTADDGKDLYVFFEAFLDNTFDHGKDFAAVHVRFGDEIKTYKVHTTAENEYGRWYFDYTDSSDVYNWEHMCYVVKVPLADLTAKDGNLDLAFEYYGTAYTEDRLLVVSIGDVSIADKEYGKSEYNPDGWYKDADYDLPKEGKTLNSMGGNTKSGSWWLTNTGYNEETETYDYELTLDNASISSPCDSLSSSTKDSYFCCAGNLTIVLKDGTINTFGGNDVNKYGMFISGHKHTIKGNGTLNIYASRYAYYSVGEDLICDGAKVNSTIGGTPEDNSIYGFCAGKLTVDNSTLIVKNHSNSKYNSGVYTGILTVKNEGSVESYTSGASETNYAVRLYCNDPEQNKYEVYGGSSELYEGNAPAGNKVDKLTNTATDEYEQKYYLYSKPYVKIISKKTPEETPKATFTATGTDCGTLANVTTANVVSLDGGSTWTAVTGDNMALTGVTASKGILVKLTTSDPDNRKDSEVQTIRITQASKPANLGKVDVTTKGGTGSITRVTTAMEYRKDGETSYKAITATTITGLDAGTYYVRVKASGTVLASPDSAAVIIAPYVTPTATPTSEPTATPTPVPVLTLNKSTAELICAKTLTLKATLKNSKEQITWASSDTKIATVDAKGKITAKMAGNVTITAAAAGKTASCKVAVLYKDVTDKSEFWYKPTYYLTETGVAKGYANQTEFRPANDCTRAQMVTFLWRLQGEPQPKSTSCNFADVQSDDYFYKPVLWAVEKGITTGVSKTKFNPQGICTRAQTVTFLWRMAKKPDPKATSCKFKDVKKGDYFYKATIWASEMKIVAGYSDGTFKPQGKCLRRQMVTFLYKYDKYINKK